MTQIFIGNLTDSVSEPELRTMFKRYGRVGSVRLPTDRATGRARGFAFVEMPSSEDAEEAIARLNGCNLAGRAIHVNEAKGDDRVSAKAGHDQAVNRLNLL